MRQRPSSLLLSLGAPLLLLLLGVAGVADASKDHHPENAGCPIKCHHGKCVEVQVGVEYRCECHSPGQHSEDMIGYSGPSCDIPYQQCPDRSRRCYNNAECVASRKGTFECDCSAAYAISSYAGHECEYSATEVCEAGTPVSDDAFCVNGGRCRKTVLKGEDHPGCHCPEEFEGSKCQYLKGTAPKGEGTAFAASRPMTRADERMNGGLVAVIVLITLGFVLGVAALIYVKKRDEREGGRPIFLESGAYEDKGGGGPTTAAAPDMQQTTGESSNGDAKGGGFGRDLILEPDGTGTLGVESPHRNNISAGEGDQRGGGGANGNADALEGAEDEFDEESALEML